MSKNAKYVILLISMIMIDLVVYVYCAHNSLSNTVNPIFHSVIFFEIAVYSTLILLELTNKDK